MEHNHCCHHYCECELKLREIHIPIFYTCKVSWKNNLPAILVNKKIEPADYLTFVGLTSQEIDEIQKALSVLVKRDVKFFQEKSPT